MKHSVGAAVAIFGAWTLLDALSHRLVLEPFYASNPDLWRPVAEISPLGVSAVTALLVALFIAIYQRLVHPKSTGAALATGVLVGVALGTASGFGTYLHSPIPLALAWGWFVLGSVKGLAAGAILSVFIRNGLPVHGRS